MTAAPHSHREERRYSRKLGLKLTETLWEELARNKGSKVKMLNHILTLAEALHEDTSHAGDVPSKRLDQFEPILEEGLASGDMVLGAEAGTGAPKSTVSTIRT